MITGAIFDVDGTLFDSMYVWSHFGSNYFIRRGLTPDPAVEETIRYMSLAEAAAYFHTAYHIPGSPEEIAEDCNRMLEEYYFEKIQPRPGILALLEALWNAHIPMCIATATDRYLVDAALKRTGLSHYFCGMATCPEVGAGKTRPDVFFAAQKLLGTQTASTWVFEDARHAVITAKNYGFPVCAVSDLDEADHAEEIRRLADIYVESFEGLSTARLFTD